MIETLSTVEVSTFDKNTLKILKPYFDLNLTECSREQRVHWFQNLFVLAQHDLSVAHCVQHNHHPRQHIEVKFKGRSYPDFYDPVYENQIGCFSNFKSSDTMVLDGNKISGTKHWISLVDQADFGVFRVPMGDTEACVLIDFNAAKPRIDFSHSTPIGMTVARPGSITVDNLTLPQDHILEYRKYQDNSKEFFHILSMSDYCFITNYVGLLVALHKDLETYVERSKIDVDFEVRKIGLRVAGLIMSWQDNLPSLEIVAPNDEFWRKRNTLYTQNKDALLDLIHLILQVGDSSWLDAKSPTNQRFRDALSFSSHMKPLYKNLKERHFVRV